MKIEVKVPVLPESITEATLVNWHRKAGEAVKLVCVRKDPSVTEAQVRAFCEANLTGYKRPRSIEFREALPKSTIGKILRRELRDAKT